MIKFKSTVIGMLVTVTTLSSFVYADPTPDYQLKIDILPLDCTLTEVSNGSGTTVNSDCPSQNPIIESVSYNNTRLLITGLFDSANSSRFRVFFSNRWYMLGQNSELTAVGNVWRLQIPNTNNAIQAGEHDVNVNMKDLNGNEHQAYQRITLTNPLAPIDPEKDTGDGKLANGALASTGQDIVLIGVISLLMISSGAMLLLYLRRL